MKNYTPPLRSHLPLHRMWWLSGWRNCGSAADGILPDPRRTSLFRFVANPRRWRRADSNCLHNSVKSLS